MTDLSSVIERAAPSVVQVQGRRRPASGLVYAADVVLTTVRALGREDGVRVRRHDGETLDAEPGGWDPATGLVALRVAGLQGEPLQRAGEPARVGQYAIALARSWSNAVTASAGIVSVIGGPLPTGRRRAIDQVIRITAPMHEGFAGGACLDATGGLLGIATGTEIRGFGVIIPSAIAWKAAEAVLAHGGMRRGYLGLAGQPVELPERQRQNGHAEALLVVAVTVDSPAARAGMLVGDLVIGFDGEPVHSPEDLLHHLTGDRIGRNVALRVLRGGAPVEVRVTISERPRSR